MSIQQASGTQPLLPMPRPFTALLPMSQLHSAQLFNPNGNAPLQPEKHSQFLSHSTCQQQPLTASSSNSQQVQQIPTAVHHTYAGSVDMSLPLPAVPKVNSAAPWRSLSKVDVFKQHPHEDSYGCLVFAHVDPAVQLSSESFASTPMHDLRFLMVQRAGTPAFHNIIVAMQECPLMRGAKEDWWLRREMTRCTDGELDALADEFDALWSEPCRVSPSWKSDFHDANETLARANHPYFQQLADALRAARAISSAAADTAFGLSDEHNLRMLNFVIPKGQMQTVSSLQRVPQLAAALVVDTDPFACAVREVVEEASLPASEFSVCRKLAPLLFCQNPPHKVEVFFAVLGAGSIFHPSARPEGWAPSPANAETRKCRWFSVTEVLDYFRHAKIFANTYTSALVHQLIQRQGWHAQLANPAIAQTKA
jgi:hypothetical protein